MKHARWHDYRKDGGNKGMDAYFEPRVDEHDDQQSGYGQDSHAPALTT
ncbi:hypothetical protein ACTXMB_15085 [Arthrobacter rhombi]